MFKRHGGVELAVAEFLKAHRMGCNCVRVREITEILLVIGRLAGKIGSPTGNQLVIVPGKGAFQKPVGLIRQDELLHSLRPQDFGYLVRNPLIGFRENHIQRHGFGSGVKDARNEQGDVIPMPRPTTNPLDRLTVHRYDQDLVLGLLRTAKLEFPVSKYRGDPPQTGMNMLPEKSAVKPPLDTQFINVKSKGKKNNKRDLQQPKLVFH